MRLLTNGTRPFATLCLLLALSTGASLAQQSDVAPTPAAPGNDVAVTTQAAAQTFSIRGTIHSGVTKLPGVTVTAAHSLTGRKVITSTDVDGSFHLQLPSKGRWVLRTEFAAFASQAFEVLLTPAQPQAVHDFELVLLSRVPKAANNDDAVAEQTPARTREPGAAANSGRGARRLTLSADDAALAQSNSASDSDSAGSGMSGLANSADATNQSVSITGRGGNAQDFGLQNMDDLRERIDEMRARGQLNSFGAGGPGGPGGGDGVFIMGGGPPGGGPGGGFGRMRIGSLTRPHGQIYYNASNGALDAAPYALNGRETEKPGYGSNRFGGMLGGPVKIPHVYDDGGKTFAFLNYSGTRSSTPYDVFSHVPTDAERNGDFSDTTVNGSPVLLFDPSHPGQLLGNGTMLPSGNIREQAKALLNFIPHPNINNGSFQNFRFTSAADTNSDIFALRLIHNFGTSSAQHGPPPPPGMPDFGGGGRGRRPRNNISFGLNYQRNESQTLEPFPQVGGSTHSNGFNANVGWALSKGKLSNQLRFTWNRSRVHTSNFYAGVNDVAALAGIEGVASGQANAIDWGVPGLSFADYTSLTDVAPTQRDFQTFTLSENLGWVRGKHHFHFGTDYRWIDNSAYSSSNPRGTFIFTGSSTANYINGTQVAGTGYDFADFLLGYAQQTSLAYSTVKDEFLARSYDFFAQDDWRARGNLTLNFGLRYEFITPYSESSNRLANLIANYDANGVFQGVTPVSPGSRFGNTLIHPDRNNFAPRLGIAWKPFGQKTVVRAGYSVNYNLGQYASIVQNLAAQPPFAVTQTNTAAATAPSTLTLKNGFTVPDPSVITNNYGIDPNYRVAYVQMWNLNIQHEITSTLLINVGYTGSKGTALDMLRAPNRGPDGLKIADVQPFNWETSQGSSILHAGSVRIRKRMSRGFAVGGTYTYSKSIDNASSIGGGAQVVAQNDLDLRAERGLSSFDQRHKLTGDWMMELPFGDGHRWLAKPGAAQKLFGDWLLQSSFTIASGTPFTARVFGNISDVARGTNGTLRANYNGQGVEISDRTLGHWFNTAAFSVPAAGTYGNSGRNTIIGPGTILMNLALSKNFRLKESTGLELRAEAANVLNHPNYSGIDTIVNSPTFGQVISVGSMRKMTLSMHYRF